MYDMILRVVEKPLLEVVMEQADGNQSQAAEWLGINRNTLRKKLQQHGLMKSARPATFPFGYSSSS